MAHRAQLRTVALSIDSPLIAIYRRTINSIKRLVNARIIVAISFGSHFSTPSEIHLPGRREWRDYCVRIRNSKRPGARAQDLAGIPNRYLG